MYTEKKPAWVRPLVIVLVIGGVLLGLGIVGWSWRQSRIRAQDESAYVALIEHLGRFEELKYRENVSSDEWKAFSESVNVCIAMHAHSSLEPYLLALRAEILRRTGELAEAQAVMQRALTGMKHVPVMIGVHTLAYAQMLMESDEQKVREQGRALMLQYAQEKRAELQGVAWYQLHHYAVVSKDDVLKAMAEERLRGFPRWQQLVKLHAGTLEE